MTSNNCDSIMKYDHNRVHFASTRWEIPSFRILVSWCRYFVYLNTWHIRIHDIPSYDPNLPQLYICFHLSRHEFWFFHERDAHSERSRIPLIADMKIFRFRSMNMFIVDRSISYTFIILNYSNCQNSTPFWTFSGISPLKSPKHRNVEMMKL